MFFIYLLSLFLYLFGVYTVFKKHFTNTTVASITGNLAETVGNAISSACLLAELPRYGR